MRTANSKTKIFVDGNCIVCDFEISHYKRKAPDLFEIIDISDPTFNSKEFGLEFEDVNTNIHVMTPEGEFKIGVEAFAHIWSRIGTYKFASKLILSPVVKPIAKVGYKIFTYVRPYLPKKK